MNMHHAQQWSKDVKWLIVLLSVLWGLVGCGPGTRLHYTVPDQYTGFLVIEFDCANGRPVNRDGRSVQLVFDHRGVACISDRYEDIYPTGVSSVASVRTYSGETLPFAVGGAGRGDNVALMGATVMKYREVPTNTETIFEILWVGPQSELRRLIAEREYTTARADFFEQSLGIPPSAGLRRTPTPDATIRP
jgi:hypothetical protein